MAQTPSTNDDSAVVPIVRFYNDEGRLPESVDEYAHWLDDDSLVKEVRETYKWPKRTVSDSVLIEELIRRFKALQAINTRHYRH